MSLGQTIQTLSLGKTYLFFLGQAGFIIKSSTGALIAVDLYLSNCCERYYGYKRLMPYLLHPMELEFDYIVVTHAHEDHFDVDSLPQMMTNHKTKLIAAKDAYHRAEDISLPMEQVVCMSEGEQYQDSRFKLQAVFCDHGKETPDAIGLVLEVDNKTFYITGDTALRLDQVSNILKYGPFHVMICPINGKFGNLNEHEAVTLCEQIHPNVIIPCHYWNFAEHGGDPGVFQSVIKEKLPNQNYIIMTMGEWIVL